MLAVCYRSLYLLNLKYAVTELPDLMTLYQYHEASDELEDVLKILFKYTLTQAQYICVLQPLVDLSPPETFVEVLGLLHSLNIINEMFLIQLPSISRVELIKQILKRGREEDAGKISQLLNTLGATLELPVGLWSVAPEPAEEETMETPTSESAPVGRDASFKLNSREEESVPLIPASELGTYKSWAYIHDYMPTDDELMTILEGPVN